ncbi:glycine cleavage system protein H, partial [Listeria monocytogenes]|nr:glycine cleavage system protein H [Listeria monocytogenes]
LINSNPYDTGWILKLEEVEEAYVKALLSSDDYEKVLD